MPEGFFAKHQAAAPMWRLHSKRGVFNGIVDLKLLHRYLAKINENPKFFTWTADTHAIVEKVRCGKRVLSGSTRTSCG